MELRTARFGEVNYEQHDVLTLSGLQPHESSWLLLADKSHPHLYWLQSTTDATWAIPLCSLASVHGVEGVRISGTPGLPGWMGRTSLIALAEVREEPLGCSLDLQQPILIDPRAHRGIRLSLDGDQTLQYVPSEKVAPLRKCA